VKHDLQHDTATPSNRLLGPVQQRLSDYECDMTCCMCQQLQAEAASTRCHLGCGTPCCWR